MTNDRNLHRFTVDQELIGLRLDRALAELNSDWSRSRVRRLIDQGRVMLNGKPAKPAALVQAGDQIEVDEPPPQPLDMQAEDIPLVVVFEDEDILVIDKPADLVIHPAAGNPAGTLVNALLHHCDNLPGIGGVERPGIVHRLDKDTTGLMVVAKTDRAHMKLSRAFSWQEVHKTYLAVCYGTLKQPEGLIDAAIDRHPRLRQHMAVVPATGRPAQTRYEAAENLCGTTLVRCRLITGRTHQIRVHMAHIGHALVGDPLYAGRQWRQIDDGRARGLCKAFPRQALHAWRLSFDHPASEERVDFEAPPHPDMAGLIDQLRECRHAAS